MHSPTRLRRVSVRFALVLLGMAVFLGSWAMLFVALFFAYAFLRARAPSWPPLDAPSLPRLLPGLNTLVIAASSVAVVRVSSQLRLIWGSVTPKRARRSMRAVYERRSAGYKPRESQPKQPSLRSAKRAR